MDQTNASPVDFMTVRPPTISEFTWGIVLYRELWGGDPYGLLNELTKNRIIDEQQREAAFTGILQYRHNKEQAGM